ncbi:MAG: YigZ family protein [Synergistaceae bacterium]|nr:YigZ family protein [Synergistaceae bacterium]
MGYLIFFENNSFFLTNPSPLSARFFNAPVFYPYRLFLMKFAFKDVLEKDQYFSLLGSSCFEATIKRSRFIACVQSAPTRADAEHFLKDITSKYPKANHYCWAYRFFGPPEAEYATDAGEPSGTAGRPILGALKKFSLFDVAAVVTRYYGGIKLGVRGLIAAYGETVTHAIENADIVVREPMFAISFTCSYEIFSILSEMFSRAGADISALNPVFAEIISGEIYVPKRHCDSISKQLQELKARARVFNYMIS